MTNLGIELPPWTDNGTDASKQGREYFRQVAWEARLVFFARERAEKRPLFHGNSVPFGIDTARRVATLRGARRAIVFRVLFITRASVRHVSATKLPSILAMRRLRTATRAHFFFSSSIVVRPRSANASRLSFASPIAMLGRKVAQQFIVPWDNIFRRRLVASFPAFLFQFALRRSVESRAHPGMMDARLWPNSNAERY